MRYYIIGTCLLPGRPVLRPLGNRKGQTLVEYALILSIISVVAVSVMASLTGQVKTAFTTVDQQLVIGATGQASTSTAPPSGR